MYILGISAYYHDSAAVLLRDGEIVAAAQEERFTRKKHDSSFPRHAVEYVLGEEGISLGQVSAVVFYDKPLLKFERLLETYHGYAPSGWRSFVTAIPAWVKEKLFLKSEIRRQLQEFCGAGEKLPPLRFTEHHLSHAASAFYASPYQDAAVLCLDGVGEWATTTLWRGEGNQLTLLRELDFPHSLGLLYSAFTAYCGFRVNSGEYKLMGLAPYGMAGSPRVQEYERKIREELVDIREDGSFLLNMRYFSYPTGLRMYDERRWKKLFGISPRPLGDEGLTQEYMDMALAIQNVTEEIVLRLAQTARELTGCNYLCLAGGVALNCVANGKLLREGIFDGIWIQPASGDAGGALGAALAQWHLSEGKARVADGKGDLMRGAYLGPSFSEKEVERMLHRFGAKAEVIAEEDRLCEIVAEELRAGKIVGWFQGRMEFGPRALGNRSILGNPQDPEMQKRLNLKIKFREGFRPFAPAVLREKTGVYFDLDVASPYMLLTAPVAMNLRNPLPEGYGKLPMYERLYTQRSCLPAITHIDFSARVQTVDGQWNPRFQKLLQAFGRVSGKAVLVNTSFNVRGEPIVCTPKDAYLCFMRTEMDILVVGNALLRKENQPPLQDQRTVGELFRKD